MGTYFKIACEDCFEFLDLHKWFPDDELSDRHPGDLRIAQFCGSETSYRKVKQAIATTQNGFLKQCPDHWIQKMVPHLERFIHSHSEHKLIIYNDCGDLPWYPYSEGWDRWKEIDGPMSCWGEDFKDVDLPRNIIDDIGIDNWPDALEHYKNNCPCITYPEIPADLEAVFKSHLP